MYLSTVQLQDAHVRTREDYKVVVSQLSPNTFVAHADLTLV